MGSRSSTAVDLSKVCAHNKLCSSVHSIDLPLRQGEREKTGLSLCHYVFTSLMILFFPTITLSLLVLPSFTPFALQERTLSLDMYLGSEIIN